MRCPACDAEASEKAIYCHKCGERLDTGGDMLAPFEDQQNQLPANSDLEGDPAPVEEAVPEPAPDEPVAAAGPQSIPEALAAQRKLPDEPEKELWKGTYSNKAMIGAWVACGLITLGVLVLGFWLWEYTAWRIMLLVVLLLWPYHYLVLKYRRLSVRYRLTSQRFFHEIGILRRVTDRIEVIDMDDITFEQKLLERLVGVGTIRITSSDRSHPLLVLRGIEHVKNVAEMMDDARRAERMRRGLHIEQI